MTTAIEAVERHYVLEEAVDWLNRRGFTVTLVQMRGWVYRKKIRTTKLMGRHYIAESTLQELIARKD